MTPRDWLDLSVITGVSGLLFGLLGALVWLGLFFGAWALVRKVDEVGVE